MIERIHGGLSSGYDPSDFDPKQLRIGTKVEMEHTDDPLVAREIAMDHLAEHPDYYRELAKMEKKLSVHPNPNGHYVLIQEPRRGGVYVRCRDADQCLCVVERELKENMIGTRITMFRKQPRQHAELIAMWKIEQGGARRYRVNTKKVKTPTLDAFLDSGDAWLEKDEYVGRASDGTVVRLGDVHFPEATERYLKAHPTPDTW